MLLLDYIQISKREFTMTFDDKMKEIFRDMGVEIDPVVVKEQ